MNKKIIDEINNLKEKIFNEIESLSYYDELSYICKSLLEEVNKYEYDPNNNLSLKQYKAYLEIFLEQIIGYTNNLIINKNNDSIFDNRKEEDLNNLTILKKEIEILLSYINDNFPILGEGIKDEYDRINDYYEKQLEYTKNSSKRRFNNNININQEPILSVYSDTSSVLISYKNSLTHFKITSVDSIKVFVDNDLKVKALFKRAYETLKEPKVIEAVKALESNYYGEINKCMNSGSLYTNTNILQLDKIIDREKEKNEYYNIITNMNFNYDDIDELLKIEKYVNDNSNFIDEFYQVLFALIEKEKYLNIKYGKKPVIYDKISDKSKVIIERMFLLRLKETDIDNKENVITKLKKQGYISVLDNRYEEFFDNNNFSLETTYERNKIPNNSKLECKYVIPKYIENHYRITDRETGKLYDRLFILSDSDPFAGFGDIYRFSGTKMTSFICKPVVYYYDLNGKRINPFKDDDTKIINRIFDLYIVKDKNDKMRVTDLEYNTVFDYSCFKSDNYMLVDYRRENIIIYDSHNRVFILYDKHFQEIKKINASSVIKDDNVPIDDIEISFNRKICMFNDGIVSMIVKYDNKTYICYYDVINMKTIDMFIFIYSDSLFGYSEGVYNFCDDINRIGYKNLNGDVVIKPVHMATKPFLNGCAIVDNYSNTEESIMNHQGNTCSISKLISPSKKEKIIENIKENRYEITDECGHVTDYISVNSNYLLNHDGNILDVDLKQEVKKKQIIKKGN